MGKIISDKRYGGFLWHFVIVVPFIGFSLLIMKFLSGTSWFIVSSVLRIIFGVAILAVVAKLFEKRPAEVLSLKNTGKALVAGAGFILLLLYEIVTVATGFGGFTGLTVGLFVTKILLQQLTTGFYEELAYRFLLLEGLKHTKNKVSTKLIYVLISSVLFGVLHCIPTWDTYTFLRTAAMGIGFAVIFVKSGNIVVPMVLHFLYDVAVKIAVHTEWNDSDIFTSLSSVFEIVLVVMVVISLVMLFVRAGESERVNGAAS